MASESTNEPNAMAEELRGILTRSVEGNLQLLTRVSNLAREAAQSAGTNATKTPPQPTEVINRIVRLNLSYLSLLSKHGLAFADELATATEKALGLRTTGTMSSPGQKESPAPGTGAGSPRAEINLNSRIGETAVAAFMVDNNTKEGAMRVTFESSGVVDRKNVAVPGAKIQFDPKSLELKAGGQAPVKALIPITREFKAGEVYVARLRVLGADEQEIWVTLNILQDAPADGGEQSRAKAAAAKKSKKAKRK